MPDILYTEIRTGQTWTMKKVLIPKDIFGRDIEPQSELIIRQNGQVISLSRFQIQVILKYIMED